MDNRFHLRSQTGGALMFSAKHASCVLKRDRRYRRGRKTTKRRDRLDIVDEGLDAPRKAPTPGQHSDEVLRELGLDEARIAALRSSGVI